MLFQTFHYVTHTTRTHIQTQTEQPCFLTPDRDVENKKHFRGFTQIQWLWGRGWRLFLRLAGNITPLQQTVYQ